MHEQLKSGSEPSLSNVIVISSASDSEFSNLEAGEEVLLPVSPEKSLHPNQEVDISPMHVVCDLHVLNVFAFALTDQGQD